MVEDGKTASISFKLIPNFFTLNLAPTPGFTGTLYIDGQIRGALPQTIQLPFREVSVKVVPDNARYREWIATISPKTKGSTEKPIVSFPPRQGTLLVTTTPDSDAELVLTPTGGSVQKIGSAPLDWTGMIGDYNLTATATIGGKKLTGMATVTVREGQNSDVRVELKDFDTVLQNTTAANQNQVMNVAEQTNSIGLTALPVEGGSFTYPDKKVSISSFYMGKTPVTQSQYQAVMGNNPSNFRNGPDAPMRPVEQVSWFDAVAFCNKLSQKDGLPLVYTINGTNVTADFTKNGWRLPTGAEFEFAARGGTLSKGYKYAGSDNIDNVAWHKGNSGKTTHPVAAKQANELGLFDMSGNISQWCGDWWEEYHSNNKEPTGAEIGTRRVIRGGSYVDIPLYCEVSYIGFASKPDSLFSSQGFRVVRSIQPNNLDSKSMTIGITTITIAGGNFSTKNSTKVSISSFLLGKTPVTQAQYQAVMGTNPSGFKDGAHAPQRPVEQVSWFDAVAFCNKLSQNDGLQAVYTINGSNVTADFTKNGWRLPTQAEFEFAARGGIKSHGYKYAGSNDIELVAWYEKNSRFTTHPVATKQANELGLFDMSGNVWQWCNDWSGTYPSSTNDPKGADTGTYKIQLGGSWNKATGYAEIGYESMENPTYNRGNAMGFCVARSNTNR